MVAGSGNQVDSQVLEQVVQQMVAGNGNQVDSQGVLQVVEQVVAGSGSQVGTPVGSQETLQTGGLMQQWLMKS